MTVGMPSVVFPWSLSLEEDRRFHRILALSLLCSLVVGAVVPQIPIPLVDTSWITAAPPRRVRLLEPSPRLEPFKSQVVSRPVSPDPAADPQPVAPGQSARTAVADTGVLALSDALTKLRTRIPRADSQARHTESPAATVSPRRPSLLAEGLTDVSGAVEVSVSRASVLGDTDLPERQSMVRGFSDTDVDAVGGAETSSATASTRSEEDIQEVLDRHKSAIYTLYDRALHRNPELQGKLLLRLAISSSGSVLRCEVMESNMGAELLERELVALVKSIDFGQRVGSQVVTTRVPIEFFPQ